MKKKLSTIAILLSLSASLAFAGGKKDKSTGSDDSQPAVTAPGAEAGAEAGAGTDQNPCATSQPKEKAKKQKQQEPTNQEKQFDKVLMGIYG